MSDSTEIILPPGHDHTPARRRRTDDPVGPPPAIVTAAGAGAEFAWDEFFKGQIANAYTRRNYAHAVRDFLGWCDHPDRQIPLVRITPGHVGDYLADSSWRPPPRSSGWRRCESSSTCWSSATSSFLTRPQASGPSATRSSRARPPRSAPSRPATS